MTFATFETRIDLRSLGVHERHPLVFSTVRDLNPFESLEVITDRDPQPLYGRPKLEQPDALAWEVIENGPGQLARTHHQARCRA